MAYETFMAESKSSKSNWGFEVDAAPSLQPQHPPPHPIRCVMTAQRLGKYSNYSSVPNRVRVSGSETARKSKSFNFLPSLPSEFACNLFYEKEGNPEQKQIECKSQL